MATKDTQKPDLQEKQTEDTSANVDDRLNELSEGQRQYLEKIFLSFDSNGDGSLSVHELGNTVRTLGWNPTEQQIKDIIKEVDQEGNQNGTLELNEFMELMVKYKFFLSSESVKEEEKELEEAFKMMDKSCTGFITADDLRLVLTDLGDEPLTLEEAEEIIKDADKNGDGQLDYQEFKEKMTKSLFENCTEWC